MLSLNLSVIQQLVLTLDMSFLHQSVLLLDGIFDSSLYVLSWELSGIQQLVLHQNMSVYKNLWCTCTVYTHHMYTCL